jgi:hypothetical protein
LWLGVVLFELEAARFVPGLSVLYPFVEMLDSQLLGDDTG